MHKLTLQEVKQAMADSQFRKKLPHNLKEDVQKYESNPGCACNHSVYRNVIRYAAQQLRDYYPDREIPNPDAELTENRWLVINCHIDDLENKLKKLAPGRKQICLARYEDQITALINEMDI